MSDIEQAARDEAERRYPTRESADGWTGAEYRRDSAKRTGFEEGASWLAEHLLSDETVERAARGIHEVVEAGTPWDDTTVIQRTDRRVEARAALSAAIGKGEA